MNECLHNSKPYRSFPIESMEDWKYWNLKVVSNFCSSFDGDVSGGVFSRSGFATGERMVLHNWKSSIFPPKFLRFWWRPAWVSVVFLIPLQIPWHFQEKEGIPTYLAKNADAIWYLSWCHSSWSQFSLSDLWRVWNHSPNHSKVRWSMMNVTFKAQSLSYKGRLVV